MAFRIYTKTGDKGSTSLIGGTKVPKSHIRIESYGTIDELNSYIGLIIANVQDVKSLDTLKEIQDRLFTIGSKLATDPGKETKMVLPELRDADVEKLENEIDRMDDQLPEMKSFILPGGSTPVAFIHIARCICRRAERICVHMQQDGMHVEDRVLQYLNRLSDYLFILARYISQVSGIADIPWRPKI